MSLSLSKNVSGSSLSTDSYNFALIINKPTSYQHFLFFECGVEFFFFFYFIQESLFDASIDVHYKPLMGQYNHE